MRSVDYLTDQMHNAIHNLTIIVSRLAFSNEYVFTQHDADTVRRQHLLYLAVALRVDDLIDEGYCVGKYSMVEARVCIQRLERGV